MKVFASVLLCASAIAMAIFPSHAADASEAYDWTSIPVGGGGNIPCLAIHPKVKDVMYIGADVGAVDRWDPEHARWIPTMNFRGAQRGCYALAVDPSDRSGNIVWAAIGSPDSPPFKGEILVSTNRGETWTSPSKTRFPNLSNGDQGFTSRLAVDPANGKVAYFAARNGLWRTTDGGVTWQGVTNAPAGDQSNLAKHPGPCGDVMVIVDPTSGTLPDPVRTRRVYISPYRAPLSRSEDGGTTWETMAGAPVDVRCAAIDPDGVLYGASNPQPVAAGTNTPPDTSGGVYRYSGGSSGTWTKITPAKMDEKYWSSIAVDPFNKANILALHNYTPCYSTNGGATWAYIAAQGVNQSTHATPDWYNRSHQSQFGWGGKNLRFDPFRKGTVWETDCFMPWRTSDIYAQVVHWESCTAGHEETVGLCGLISPPSGPTELYSSAADVFGFRHRSVADWPMQMVLKRYNSQLQICGADFEEADPNFAAFVGPITYNGPGYGGYTTDGGETFRTFASPPDAFPNSGGRIAVSATCRTMVWATGYAGKWGIGYSTDSGATWKASVGLPIRAIPTGYNVFAFMTPLCSDRVNGRTFYFYHPRADKDDKTAFYRSTDGGASFAPVSSNTLPTEGNVNLVASFAREGELWLSARAQGLWHSTDGGQEWRRIAAVKVSGMIGIGKGPGNKTPSLYLIGKLGNDAQEGIYRSDDLGNSWIQINVERPYPNDWVYMCGDRRTYGTVYIESSNGIWMGRRSSQANDAQHVDGDTGQPVKR